MASVQNIYLVTTNCTTPCYVLARSITGVGHAISKHYSKLHYSNRQWAIMFGAKGTAQSVIHYATVQTGCGTIQWHGNKPLAHQRAQHYLNFTINRNANTGAYTVPQAQTKKG